MEEIAAPIAEVESRYSPLQLHFLRRLNRLLRLRQEQTADLNSDGLRLIDRAIYCTYCDASDVGVAEEARKLVRSLPVASRERD